MDLTDRILADAGGWQAMKQARALHDMGRVIAASYEAPLLQGRVRDGETEYRAGLRVLSKSNLENLCGCRASRQFGTICAHSLAVGLEVLKPKAASAAPAAQIPAPGPPSTAAGPVFRADAGEPIQLFVVLPANFPGAWEKGSITVGAEVAVAGRRVLLSALDPARKYRCAAEDARIIEKLRSLNDGKVPGVAIFPKGPFLDFLDALAGHPRVSLGKGPSVQINSQVWRPALSIRTGSDGQLHLKIALPEGALPLLAPANVAFFKGTEFHRLAPGLPAAYHDLFSREVAVPAANAAAFAERELPQLDRYFELPGDHVVARGLPAKHQIDAPRFTLEIEGSLNHLVAKLHSESGGGRVTLSGSGSRAHHSAETAALERLRASGFSGSDSKGELILKGEQAILGFFAGALPRLQREWNVRVGSRFDHVTRDVERIEPRLEVSSSGENWFELNVELATHSGDRFSAAEIQRLLQSGRSSVRLKSGKVAVFDPAMLDEFQQVLTDCNPQQRQPGRYRIDDRHAGYLAGSAEESGLRLSAPAEWRSPLTEDPTEIDLGELEEVLRPYQKEGVYWLNRHAARGQCGILADEMGLGKTLQTLAFLRTLEGRFLVVCPSSLVFNWEREAARFAPNLSALVLTGPKRHELWPQIATARLIITSYALLRRDLSRYESIPFQCVVLDEAQHIKNPESQNAAAAQALRSEHRLVLTGTPIENSIRDIWSIMNFLMPGYLGGRKDFRERFELPIQQDPNGRENRRLALRLRPYVLRRLKLDVAKELPDKLEQVAYCELNIAQREAYSSLLESTRRQASELSGSKDRQKARILMLTALLRLRQACCDLRLLDLDTSATSEPSGKMELLAELLQQAGDGGHRTLVFSQFVGMLRLIQEQLDATGLEYCYLDGSTKDRQGAVDAFQNGTAPVFLISLKAGGVGLNLTAADTVIHFDPWWNPAVEAQATDRAHRIGQTKVVTSYKLIARDTVEEKIMRLQSAKRDVAASLLAGEDSLGGALTTEEIEGLLT